MLCRFIISFCTSIKPALWQPTAPEIKELQALMRRLDSLQEMVTAERNRLETAARVRRVSRRISETRQLPPK